MKGTNRETIERDMLLINLSETTVITGTLDWLVGFGCVVAHGQDISRNGPTPEPP